MSPRVAGENAPVPVNVLDLIDGPALDMVYGRLSLTGAVDRGEHTLLRALKQEEGMNNLELSTLVSQL